MIRIGLVDLDTSHPAAFTRIIRGIPGVEVSALWDGHDVWPVGYDHEFAKQNGIPTVCSRLTEMPMYVDAAMIHGVNWDTHYDKAAVFLREKIPVLIDKPVVGSVRDGDRLADLQAKFGVPVYGGSSLRCAPEVEALRGVLGPRKQIVSLVASGPGDFFSYGIHTTEMLQGCAGNGITSVRALAGHRIPMYAMTYKDGLTAIVHLERQSHQWSLVAYTGDGMHATTVNPDTLYEPFLRRFIAMLEGKSVDFALAGPLEAVRVHIAAKLARETGREIRIDRLPSNAGFDGGAFAAEFAAMKRRQVVPLPPR